MELVEPVEPVDPVEPVEPDDPEEEPPSQVKLDNWAAVQIAFRPIQPHVLVPFD